MNGLGFTTVPSEVRAPSTTLALHDVNLLLQVKTPLGHATRHHALGELGAHIRREVLPPPGDGASLRRLVMRILARPLDMRRPLWEMTIVTGLHGDRVVLVNRAHHAMVDGRTGHHGLAPGDRDGSII